MKSAWWTMKGFGLCAAVSAVAELVDGMGWDGMGAWWWYFCCFCAAAAARKCWKMSCCLHVCVFFSFFSSLLSVCALFVCNKPLFELHQCWGEERTQSCKHWLGDPKKCIIACIVGQFKWAHFAFNGMSIRHHTHITSMRICILNSTEEKKWNNIKYCSDCWIYNLHPRTNKQRQILDCCCCYCYCCKYIWYLNKLISYNFESEWMGASWLYFMWSAWNIQTIIISISTSAFFLSFTRSQCVHTVLPSHPVRLFLDACMHRVKRSEWYQQTGEIKCVWDASNAIVFYYLNSFTSEIHGIRLCIYWQQP